MSDAVVNGLAGAGGGVVSQVLTYPLLAVNTRQQTERKARANNTALAPKPAGTIQELFKVIKTEGWGGLYRGFMPCLIGTAFSQGVYYYFYQLLKDEVEARAQKAKKLGKGDATVGMLWSLVIAAVAGCLNVLVTNPIWVIVTRMQTQAQAQKRSEMAAKSELTTPLRSGYAVVPSIATTSESNSTPSTVEQGTLDTVKDLYNEAGVRGFWKGVLPSLIMVCNPAVQFMFYEGMLKKLTEKRVVTSRGVKYVSASEVFLLGAIAKLGATVVTYPLLVVKSRLQAKQEIGGDKYLQYTGTLDAIVKMIRFEGVAGFYKGMSTKIVQSVAAAAILFMIKEELVKAARVVATKHVKIPKLKAAGL